RGKLLLKTGDVCKYVYFIKKGAVRGFIKENQRDITTWITAENEMVTSISGLDRDEPSIENIQTIEDCEMLSIANEHLKNLYIKHPEFNVVSRKLLQQYYRDAEGRAFIARITNAENKYKYFLTKYPHLVNRIPLKYIASFLGITLETLSRIRKKLSING
ncbi:MAG: Crp/Fnr family transcriptional regulator, partial [Bacteroidetes bacterium]|nr:Crp/Fnr family transcriptional regulator [Bacteroidota bacterium]